MFLLPVCPSPGCILVPIVDQREYLAKFPAAFEAVKDGERQLLEGPFLLPPAACCHLLHPRQLSTASHSALGGAAQERASLLLPLPLLAAEFDLPAIQDFFDSIDYVGLSAYIPQSNTRFEVQH